MKRIALPLFASIILISDLGIGLAEDACKAEGSCSGDYIDTQEAGKKPFQGDFLLQKQTRRSIGENSAEEAVLLDIFAHSEQTSSADDKQCGQGCKWQAKPWTTKCTWKSCNGCGECQSPAPAPALPPPTSAPASADRPNVVFILLDDMNTDIGHLKGKDSMSHPQAETPNLDAFSKSAVSFARAFSNHPICNPSRASLLSGIYGQKSGFWSNSKKYKWYDNKMLKASKSIMSHFKDHGYFVQGTGKIEHHLVRSNWDHWQDTSDYGPVASDGSKKVAHPDMDPEVASNYLDLNWGRLSNVPFDGKDGAGWVIDRPRGAKSMDVPWNLYPWRYESDSDRDLMPDERNARWAAKQIREERTPQPFFLAVGFTKPHTPLYCPDSYFDKYPLDDIYMLDTGTLPYGPEGNGSSKSSGSRFYEALLQAGEKDQIEGLKGFQQAYLACVNFVDEQVGIVIDAVDASSARDNTIVIVTSDNGWSNGPHGEVYKNTPYDAGAGIPLMIRAPGLTPANGGRSNVPVSLIDIYPTLIDLCGLSKHTKKTPEGGDLDGYTLRPLLNKPLTDQWYGPDGAVSMVNCWYYVDPTTKANKYCASNVNQQHYSLRTPRWRYTLWTIGSGVEELFDHENDPQEKTNLAGNKKYEDQMNRLVESLRIASGVKGLKRPHVA